MGSVKLTAQNAPKPVFDRGTAPDPAGGVYDAPPNPLVGWWGGHPLHIPLPLDAFGVSISPPSSLLLKEIYANGWWWVVRSSASACRISNRVTQPAGRSLPRRSSLEHNIWSISHHRCMCLETWNWHVGGRCSVVSVSYGLEDNMMRRLVVGVNGIINSHTTRS